MERNNIHIKDLSTGYFVKGKPHILQREINAHLNPGEITALVGINGSGKSTLLRTILGYQPALHGEIILNGKPLNAYTEKEIAKMIAVIFTGGMEESYLTVYETVSMGRYPENPFGGGLTGEDKKIVDRSLTLVKMEGFSGALFHHLSDGEKQKVLIARALAQQTPYIFLDEPAAFIDIPGKIAVMELLKEIALTRHKGILLATHDLDLALQYADRIWLLGKNMPFQWGIPEDLALSGLLRDYFRQNDIVFNITNGKFEKKGAKTKRTNLYVSGSRTERFWLTKALERNGYSVGKVKPGDLKNGILCAADKFTVIKDEKPVYEAGNIAEILHFLKK